MHEDPSDVDDVDQRRERGLARERRRELVQIRGVRGLVFFGFPLHPPNKPGTKRAEHLANVHVPMLFLQGTRDTLADLKLLRPICSDLGKLATLHVIETADHSFHVLKSSGKRDADVLRELAQTTASWAEKLKIDVARVSTSD